MGRTSGTWRKGTSGNPRGRPKGGGVRSALRAVLAEPAEPGSPETKLERWARRVVESAVTLDDRLAIFRFLDGSSPSPAEVARIERLESSDAEHRPRIIIPDSPADPNRR